MDKLKEANNTLAIERTLISDDAVDSSSGIYECEVCGDDGVICNSANTTLLTVGRPPIINRGAVDPLINSEYVGEQNIGSSICIEIDVIDPNQNRPSFLERLQCGDIGQDDYLNIPTVKPSPLISWQHISLDKTKSAYFVVNKTMYDNYTINPQPTFNPPPEFQSTFPLLTGQEVIDVEYSREELSSTLIFLTKNITRHLSDPSYQALREAFGFWTCTMTNSLGTDTATTFISDDCNLCNCHPQIVNVSVTSNSIMMVTANVSVTHGNCSIHQGFRYEIDWGDGSQDNQSTAHIISFVEHHNYTSDDEQYNVTVQYCYASSNCGCNEAVELINLSSNAGIKLCEVASKYCHTNAQCIDRDGGYVCVCEAGYTGNGSFCEGVTHADNSTGSLTCSLCGSDLAILISFSFIAVVIIILMTLVVTIIVRMKAKKIHHAAGERVDVLDLAQEATETAGLMEFEELLRLELHSKNVMISKSQISLSSTIGHGEFGLVYKGYVNIHNETLLVAIKTSKALYNEREKENMLEEIQKMASLDHPNVMTLIGVCLDVDMPLIVMPFMSKGSVLEYVKDKGNNPHPPGLQDRTVSKDFLRIALQIAKGMNYLTSCKLVHRDLAARNCMIDGENVIKVADFGLSENIYGRGYFRLSRDEARNRKEKVPVRWLAPESIEHGKYNEKTDVWSFGVTCWEIFTFGRVPYAGIRAMDIFGYLKSGERLEKPHTNICTDEIYGVMGVCWSEWPSSRPRFASLVTTFDVSLQRESDYLDLLLNIPAV